MDKLVLILDSTFEEEITIMVTIMILIIFTVICLTIIKKLKDK